MKVREWLDVKRWLKITTILSLSSLVLFCSYRYAVEEKMERQIVRHIPTQCKIVALTFDDGPNKRTTPAILKILREKDVKATFFVIGESAERSPEMMREIIKDGHEIGNHTYDHEKLTELKVNKVADELKKTETIIEKYEDKPAFFRPPGGFYNRNVLATAQQMGYRLVLWSVDPRDWARPSVQQVVKTVLSHVHPGDIILLHDGQYPSPTPQAVTQVIDSLKAQGYTFVTMSELLHYAQEPD